MQPTHKQIIIMLLTITIGVAIAFSGITETIHNFLINGVAPILDEISPEKGKDLYDTVAYSAQFILLAIILVSPISAISGFWLLRIGYDLSFGINAGKNIFIISPALNKIMAFLCLILFVYSLYSQHKWSIKLTSPIPASVDDKSLAKFI